VELNPPLQIQHSEGVGGCNECNSKAAIRQLGTDHNKGEFPTDLVMEL